MNNITSEFKKYIEDGQNTPEFTIVEKEILSKYKGKSIDFIGMVDNCQYGRQYAFIIDGNTRTIIK